jgi:hypothetical protein
LEAVLIVLAATVVVVQINEEAKHLWADKELKEIANVVFHTQIQAVILRQPGPAEVLAAPDMDLAVECTVLRVAGAAEAAPE